MIVEVVVDATTLLVSIPFKRESVFRVAHGSLPGMMLSFNSLQTGKCIQSIPKVIKSDPTIDQVSIPFKRESVFRVFLLQFTSLDRKCFNSLQTGKCIQSGLVILLYLAAIKKFQFPSNGKVYSETRFRHRLYLTVDDSLHQFQFPSNGKVYSEFV